MILSGAVDLLTLRVNCCNVYDFIMLIKDIIFTARQNVRGGTNLLAFKCLLAI